MNRDKINDKYKWDLDVIYSSNEDFYKDYNIVKDKINKFKEYENDIIDNGNILLSILKDSYDIERMIDKLYSYTSLKSDLDTSVNENEALCEEVSNLYSLYSEYSYFVIPNILKNDYSDIEKFISEVEELGKYERILKKMFRYKEHTLDDSEEKLLSSMSKMFSNNGKTYELLKDSDMTLGNIKDEDGNEVELTDSNYGVYIESKNRDVRKDTFFTLYDSYKKYKNTIASLLTGEIKENSVYAKVKKYNSSLEASLFGDEIDKEVYLNLIDTVNKNMDVVYKYYDLKKEELGIEDFHIYDTYVSLDTSSDKKYEFDDALKVVMKVLKIFGEDYVNVLKKGIKDRWIDVYPTKNKRTGGYSGGCYDTYPYILLNYLDRYNDMSTLIHEIGHSMHSYYSREFNDYEYSNYTIFVAEVASTVNELLLAYHILNNTDDVNEKKYILEKLMSLFKSTIYRQTMFAEFELDLYSKIDNDEVLTADKISDIYLNLVKKYFGDGVVIDEDIKYEWIRIPHFYYNFYVYKYATGLSAACHIVNDILSGREHAVENYLEFLKCGSSKSPLESLLVAGVDLTKKEVVESAINMFDDVIEQYKELCK